MKHGILISAVCVSSLLLFGCADKKKIAELEATNQSLQAEIQNVNVQLQAGAADKAKIQELEQANQTLQAEIQKLHLQAMNATETSRSTNKAVGVKSKKNVPAKSKGKTASKAGSTAK
ncbi:MAG: hypothetical protein NT011_06075 [Kiritimatiellaeota bacterium]|nr:hypothetical protein [Kiritimatiellota bacterium]